MMDHSLLWVIAQIIGGIALLFGINAFTQKNDKTFKSKMGIFCLIESVHFFLLDAFSACLGCVVNSLRSYVSVRTKSKYVMFIFLFVLWMFGLFSIIRFDFEYLNNAYNMFGFSGILNIYSNNLIRFLPLIGSSIGTVGLFLLNDIKLRFSILICSFLWLIHNIAVVSIGPTIMEITFIIVNISTINKLLKSKK